jgi:ketosteroid isomerase-like protein
MSSANAEFVGRMLAAYLTRDEETLQAAMAPDGEIYGAPGLLNSGTYHGYEGFRQWIGQWEEAWGDVEYDLQDPVDFGETIVVIPVRITGRGAGSGLEVDSTFGWLWQIRDDKMVRFHAYPTADDALEAAKRLSEAD